MGDGRFADPTAAFLRYECVDSAHGPILVAMTEHGVVDVLLGEPGERLLCRAVARYPNVSFIPDRGRHAAWTAAVVRRLEVPLAAPPIPLDLGFGRPRSIAV